MKNANDQNFFNFVGGGLRQRVIRYIISWANQDSFNINSVWNWIKGESKTKDLRRCKATNLWVLK